MGLRYILCFCVFALCSFVTPVWADGPVVLEFFGQNGCSDDLKTQLRLHEFIRTRQDVILINCRTTDYFKVDSSLNQDERRQQREEILQQAREDEVPLYLNEFCAERGKAYSIKQGKIFYKDLLLMVNGRWMANINDILPAINLGAKDDVAKIMLAREGAMLHVNLPEELKAQKEKGGVLSLFVYAPSMGIDVGEPQDISLKDTSRKEHIRRELDGYERMIPIEEEEMSSDDYSKSLEKERNWEEMAGNHFFRPVASMKEIGVWDGKETQYDVSLETLVVETGLSPETMGYVVVLQTGKGGATPVIAAGEIVPAADKMQH